MFTNNEISKFDSIKAMSLEDFAALTKLPNAAELYNAIQNSKPGFIKITKDGTGEVNRGYTPGFCEGISCYMSTPQQWYMTSVIKKINWEEGYFITLNSKYWFTFKPVEDVKSIKEEKNVS